MLIDLHCHTTRSQDSRLQPEEAIIAARDRGLDAICFTEHDYLWPTDEIRRLSRELGLRVLTGVEVSTEVGHILAYGLPSFSLELRSFPRLVEYARTHRAALVLAHPFRRHFRFELPTVPSASDVSDGLRRRGLLDVAALEAANGATRPVENVLASKVAERLELPTTAGSDAHSADRVGLWATEVDDVVDDEADLTAAITEGRVRVMRAPPVSRL